MPRISEWINEQEGNFLHDYCTKCYEDALEGFKDDHYKLPDKFTEDDFHPDYDECDYDCEICGKLLTNDDNERRL
jgi:hypothetical protein